MVRSVACVGAFLLGMATTAAVAETPEQRQACTDDAFRVCNDAVPDQNRVFNCLVQKNQQISPLCRSALAPYLPAEHPTAQAAPRQAGKSKAPKPSKGPLNLNPNAR